MSRLSPLWILLLCAACGSPPTAVVRDNPNDFGGSAPRVPTPEFRSINCTYTTVGVGWSLAAKLPAVVLGIVEEGSVFDSIAGGGQSFRSYHIPIPEIGLRTFRFAAYAHREGLYSDTAVYDVDVIGLVDFTKAPTYPNGPSLEIRSTPGNNRFICYPEMSLGRIRVVTLADSMRIARDTGTGFESTPIHYGSVGTYLDQTFAGDSVRYMTQPIRSGKAGPAYESPWFYRSYWVMNPTVLLQPPANHVLTVHDTEHAQTTAAGPVRILVQYQDDYSNTNRIYRVGVDGQILDQMPIPRGYVFMPHVQARNMLPKYHEQSGRYYINYGGSFIRELSPTGNSFRMVRSSASGISYPYMDLDGDALVFGYQNTGTGQRQVVRHELVGGTETVITTFSGTLVWLDHDSERDLLMWIEQDSEGYRIKAIRLSDGATLYGASLPHPVKTVHPSGNDLILLEPGLTSARYLVVRTESGTVEERVVPGVTRSLVPDIRDGHLVQVATDRIRLIHADHPETPINEFRHVNFPHGNRPIGFGSGELPNIIHASTTQLLRHQLEYGYAIR